MAKVFIGGSRQVAGLEVAVCDRLDRVVTKGLPVLVGDAGGADEAVQRYFRGRGYVNVTVFSADPRPRHNVGGWPVRVVPPGRAGEGVARHASKDRAMAAEATVGLMLVEPVGLGAQVCRDADGDVVLGTAVAGRAEAIVAGDRDLLDLASYRDIAFVSPRSFWRFESQRRSGG